MLPKSPLIRAVFPLAAVLLLAAPVRATWSIVVMDLATREVCSATATCIEGHDLDLSVPVVVVGKGAGAAQAFVLSIAKNRKKIFKGLKEGKTPAEIMRAIDQTDNTTMRQFGIVGLNGAPLTFTGSGLAPNSFQWADGVAGQEGNLVYAIQGNALAGAAVVDDARTALLDTPGDLSTKVMAAMLAAYAMGGDGRCSCGGSNPMGCGTPPPGFTKSAHQAVFVLARPGDVDGVCTGAAGCANGDYYLFLHEGGSASASDPVVRMRQSYEAWRANLAGMADHYLSEVAVDRDHLPADRRSAAQVRIRLVDVDGVPLTVGGDQLRFERLVDGPERAVPGPVTDHGNGTYTFPLTATAALGPESWAVIVDRPGQRPVRLVTPVEVHTLLPEDLFLSHREWSASEDGALSFLIDRGPAEAGRAYLLLGTDAGTVPGQDLANGVHLPLNPSAFHYWTRRGHGMKRFHGLLDADGRADPVLDLEPGMAAALVGSTLHFAALLGGFVGQEVTDVVVMQVVP